MLAPPETLLWLSRDEADEIAAAEPIFVESKKIPGGIIELTLSRGGGRHRAGWKL